MVKGRKEFELLKRRAYLIILPFILLSAVITFFVRLYHEQYGFSFYINALFMIAFIIGWLSAYYNYWQRISELLIVSLLLIYYWFSLVLAIQSHVNNEVLFGNDIFVVWLPLLLMYIFAVFKKRQAIIISFSLLATSILPLLYYFQEIKNIYLETLAQLYIATAIYILIIIYAFKLFEVYLENQFMKQQLYLDPLTKIGSRHQVDEWMVAYLKKIDEPPFSIIFFDIDRFKEINDQFGHVTGDDVLREVVQVIQSKLGDQHFGRWGGEEFIIFTSISECEAFNLAEELKEALAHYEFKDVGQVTASFGVTASRKEDTVESIVKRVDGKLYESKRKGRNRVTGRF